jgi:hypothetical protein
MKKWIRDATMWTVAVLLLTGVQAATPDQQSAVWRESIAAVQGSASDRATEKEDARPAATGAAAAERRTDSTSSTLHFEVLYRWHRDATHLP